MTAKSGLELYDLTADDAARRVIARYSTSFGMASSLLGARVRSHVRNVYALVRVADEIVDGPARAAGLDAAAETRALDDLLAETRRAVQSGFSANLIVHAFARTARECAIGDDLLAPFFESMRADLSVSQHDAGSHDRYVYGSAEVVGLMCLQIFVNAGVTPSRSAPPTLVEGARRLGAAFQDVNFLRDLEHDRDVLGRDYLSANSPTERRRVLARIHDDLAAAAAVIPLLPRDCRRAVTAAHDLFASLASRLQAAEDASRSGQGQSAGSRRVRVPTPVKAALFARAAAGFGPRAPHRAGASS